MHRIGILLALSVPLVMASCQTVPGASRSAQHGEQSRVVVECTVRADGGMDRCRVLEQDAPLCGYSERALKIARAGRLSPRTLDGSSRGGTIRVAIPFPHCDVPPLDQPASNR